MTKTCIITGASRGIGRATAIELSKREDIANFIIIARTEAGLEETKKLMNQDKNIELHAKDLTNYEEIQALVQEIGKKYPTIDMLVNVAGYANPQPLLETEMSQIELAFDVNVVSLVNLTKEVVKFMKTTGGQILNVASTAGSTARPGWLAYAASKAALISVSQTLSEELADYDILVYCISPGRCATELRKILAPDEDPSTIMQPEHVGEVISNLMSEGGVCLDGQDIVVRKQVK